MFSLNTLLFVLKCSYFWFFSYPLILSKDTISLFLWPHLTERQAAYRAFMFISISFEEHIVWRGVYWKPCSHFRLQWLWDWAGMTLPSAEFLGDLLCMFSFYTLLYFVLKCCYLWFFSYPLILSIENHCSLGQQRNMASAFKDIFGGKLNESAHEILVLIT